ncbi:MAG: glycerophosphodiester phosphodiesterase, partial [Bdellovibrionota bacterium]
DGQAVVIHDADIQRVAGRAGRVRDLTATELKIQARAPTLREVLEDGECRKLLVNVELKHCPGQNARLSRAVAAAVKGFEARVLFSSFNPLLLRAMSRLVPGAPRALVATEAEEPGNKIYLRRMWLAFLARPNMLNFDGRYLTPALASRLAARHVPLAIWTISDPTEARKFLAMGAKSIISPLPKIV